MKRSICYDCPNKSETCVDTCTRTYYDDIDGCHNCAYGQKRGKWSIDYYGNIPASYQCVIDKRIVYVRPTHKCEKWERGSK